MSTNNSISDFYLTAKEYCKLVEYTSETSKIDFISKAQKILSFTYLKASLVQKPNEIGEGEVEKFVQEEDWQYIKNNVSDLIGSADRFIEVLLPEELDPENHEEVRLSESFADIYQDLKDFITSYEIGNEEGLQASLYECIFNFEKFWGQRVLAILSYLHNYLYNRELYEEDEYSANTQQTDIDTKNWLINQRFEE
jgi:hypothetical protein